MKVRKEKILIFIGAPRTGSTLLGQLINYHPKCLISNESRLITNSVVKGKSFHSELRKSIRLAKRQFKLGLENDNYYKSKVKRYQTNWSDFSKLSLDPEFNKMFVTVVGDKKAGGATEAFQKEPEIMQALIERNETIKLIQIIRNPIDAALSYMKSHSIDSFIEACTHIVEKTTIAHRFSEKYQDRYYSLFYEDLLSETVQELENICNWLSVEYTEKWLSDVSKLVNSQCKKKNYDSYLEQTKEIISKYKASDIFSKYGL